MTYRHDISELAQRARGRVDAAVESQHYLDTLYEEPPSAYVRRAIGSAHAAIRTGIKLAQVEALLAIAAELRELRADVRELRRPSPAISHHALTGDDR